MNNVYIEGTVLKAPIAYNPTSPAKFMVKVPVQGSDKSFNFIPVIAWGEQKDIALAHLHEGTNVYVEGVWTSGSYEKEGQKVYTNNLTATHIASAPPKQKAAF